MKRILAGAVVSLAVIIFTVTGCNAKPSLKVSKKQVGLGEEITVEYKAAKGYKENAWIGIIPSEIDHGSESLNDQHDLSYKYLKGSTSGSFIFRAPTRPGSYDFRMHNTDSNGVEVASVTFVVKATETAAKPRVSTGSISKGDAVLVEWKGSWWPAKVIAMRKGSTPYRIHYDGYSSSWDEWVGHSRIRKK